MDEKEKINLKIDVKIWTKAKHKCVDKNLKYSEYVEGLIKKDLVDKLNNNLEGGQ